MEDMEQAKQIVSQQWRKLSDRLRQESYPPFVHLVPLVDALMEHPRLGRLYPLTSHATLCLSRSTEYPWATNDCPHVWAVAEGRFRVFGPHYRTVAREDSNSGFRWYEAQHEVLGEGDLEQALAWMDSVLPPDCGPAVVGNEEAFRRHVGLPVSDALTRKLFGAVRDPEALAAVLGQGADVNSTDYRGYTPLMYAIMEGSEESSRALLERGADVNCRTEGGETALSLALFYSDKYPALVAMLHDAGARSRSHKT